jgi:hypothetical protein
MLFSERIGCNVVLKAVKVLACHISQWNDNARMPVGDEAGREILRDMGRIESAARAHVVHFKIHL